MKNCLPIYTVFYVLFVLFLSFPSILAAGENASDIIEKNIRQQLGENFELKSWELSDTETIKKGLAEIEKSVLTITAIINETLYKPSGRNTNGKLMLRISNTAGKTVELNGFIMKVAIPGSSKASNMKVILSSAEGYGEPLSRFSEGSYVISENDKKAKKGKDTLSEIIENENASEVQAPKNIQGNNEKLYAVYKENGEVWGIDTSAKYANSPVILRDLIIDENHQLKGTLYHPYQELTNEFSMTDGDSSVSIEIQAASPGSQGMRKAFLGGQAEDDELVIKNGARIALSTEKSRRIQEDFDRELMPWNFSGDVTDYFHFKGKLYRVDTLEEVTSSWIKSASPVCVKNFSTRFITAGTDYLPLQHPYGGYPAGQIKTAEPAGRLPLQPVPESKNPTWVSFDMDEYVTLRDGDAWHGRIDWQENTVKDEKNVTSIGILNDLEPISWYEDDFYFYYQSGSEKPILRINVKTGSIDELEETEALQTNSLGSPDGRFLCYSDGKTKYLPTGNESLLYVYDCKTRQSFTLDATVDERHYIGALKQGAKSYRVGPSDWLSDSIFITSIGWYDLEKRERWLFIEAEGVIRDQPEHYYRAIRNNFIPVSNFADVTVQSYVKKNNNKEEEVYRRYRIDRLTNTAVELPMEFEDDQHYGGDITWVDENRYVFSKKTGSLSEIGTWLYDLRTGEHEKLTSYIQNGMLIADNYFTVSNQDGSWKVPLYFYNQYLVFPDKQRIVFTTKKGSSSFLLSVSLNGEAVIEIPLKDQNGKMKRVFPYSIELP